MKKVLLLLVSTIAALLICEAIVRLAGVVDSDTLRAKFMNIKPYVEPSSNSGLVFELRKNVRVEADGCSITLNNEGRRVCESRQECAGNSATLKVAMLGDSTSFGWGVPYDKSYPVRVAQNLGFQLRNYSVPGYNSNQELLLYRDRVSAWHPDLLIVHHDHNDANPTGRYLLDDCRNPDYGNNRLHSMLLKLAIRACTPTGLAEIDRSANVVRGLSIVAGPLYEKHVGDLRSLIAEAIAAGSRVVVVAFDAQGYSDLQTQLSDRLSDLCPVIIPPSVKDYHLSASDWHPTKEGHRVIADCVQKELARIGR